MGFGELKNYLLQRRMDGDKTRKRERERLGYVSKHTVIIFNTHSSVVMYCFARVILGSVGG